MDLVERSAQSNILGGYKQSFDEYKCQSFVEESHLASIDTVVGHSKVKVSRESFNCHHSKYKDIKKSLLKGEVDGQRILRNMLELDKLFVDAVGLKISYLINKNSVGSVQMMEGVKKRDKAISADVVQAGAKLHQLIFDQGYKLEHLFLDGIG